MFAIIRIKKLCPALFIFFCLAVVKLQAQVNVYTFSQAVGTYTPLTGITTTAYGPNWDNHTAGSAHQATIPFAFTFDGVSFSQCYISPNGFITFGTNQPSFNNYTPINDNTTYNTATTGGVLCPLGVNLKGGNISSDIKYGVEGTAPNRVFVIEWNDAERVIAPGLFDFQIRLSETTNVIVFSYGTCQPQGTTPYPVQVGLRGPNNVYASGNTFNRLQGSSQLWHNTTIAGNGNGATLLTEAAAYPNLGLKYTYTPALPCAMPSAQPTNLVIGATSITDVGFFGNSFSAALPAPSRYLILRSNTATPPTAANVVNRNTYVAGTSTGAYYVIGTTTVTSFAQNTLNPDTTYHYWIIPFNDACQGGPFYRMTSILTASATTCSRATVTTAGTLVGSNGFTANWGLVTGATTYYLDVATNAGFTSMVPGFNALAVGNVNMYTLTGLSPATTYHYRVRAKGPGCMVNSNTTTVVTSCGAYNIPYYENFDALAIGVVPPCGSRLNTNADAIQWQTQAVAYTSAQRAMQIDRNTATAMNDWFFLPAINLTAGVSYRLVFKYATGGGSENLRVFYGAAQNIAGMTNMLTTMTPFNNTSFLARSVDFTPATSGNFYIGFQGSSAANQSYIAIDDVSVTVTPNCFEPTAVTLSNITATTATLSWTAAAPAPAQGYQYYVSTNSTPPNAATLPTGSTAAGVVTASLTALSANTLYYVWVRGNCTATDKSIWSLTESFNTDCVVPAISSTVPATRCGYGSATIAAAADNSAAVVNWYNTPSSGTALATGNSFTTPQVNTTTTYYAEAKASGAFARLGPVTPASQGGLLGVQNFQDYYTIAITAPTTLKSVDLYPMVSGETGVILIRNNANVALGIFPYTTTVSGGATAQQLQMDFALQPGNYNLFFDTLPASGLRMNTTNAVYPYPSSVAIVTGLGTDFGTNLGCYNWKFTTECSSVRVPVTVTVTNPPALSLSVSSVSICEGLASPLITVSGAAAYNNLVWSPSTGISGSFATGFTFNPTVTTTYYLNASQTSGSFCGNRVSLTVTVLPAPSQIAILPTNPTICENSVQALTGSTSAASPTLVYYENFNSATNNWVVQQTSIGGDVNASQWRLRPNNYSYLSAYWNVSFNSNDASQFYLANADSQTGAPAPVGTVTRTTLTSPAINLAGYTTASLNFWQYVRFTETDSFLVQVSTNNGATWTTVKSYNTVQGAPTNFSNAVVDISSYIGFPDVRIRFSFTSYWAYGWAIDNVSVTGTLATALTWLPVTNLYTDAAATIPYVANTPLSVVYTKLSNSITYNATLTGSNSCISTASSTINVTPVSVGGSVSASQYVCTGTVPANLTLTGQVGNVVRWEYADDLAFTVNVVSIANTTATLLGSQAGTIMNTRYFRAVVKNGVCSEAFSSAVFIAVPTTTWNGTSWSNGDPSPSLRAVFNGNYNSPGDLAVCSVLVNSGAVVFNTGQTLTVTNEVVVAGGTLTFESSSSLLQVNEAVNVGDIVYKRTTMPVKKFDYTYWSTPVSPQTLVGVSPFTPGDKYYRYDQVINYWVSVPSLNLMDLGRGYIIRAPYFYDATVPALYQATFNGAPNNGTITIPIVVNLGNYNLIGNPYPSALNINAFLSEPSNVPKVDATVYLWTHNTPITNNQYTSNDYAVYNYLGATGTSSAPNTGGNNTIPNGKIASGQAFFIKGLSNGNVTFRNSMRIAGNNNQFFKADQPLQSPAADLEKHRFWLDVVSPEGIYKQILVGYAETATNTIDRGFDGEFLDAGNAVAIYSFCEGQKFSIQGKMLPFDAADQVPIGFKGNVSGNYTISLYGFDGLFNDHNIYIKDTFLNVIHNLKNGAYVFHSEGGSFDNRFVIVFQSTLGTPGQLADDNAVVIYKPADRLFINNGNKLMKEVRVFDVRGRLLSHKKDIMATETSIELGHTNQVYLIQITTDDLRIINRKYVN